MRILFLTQVLPYPLDAGPKVRNYYVLRYLAQEHDVTLVSFIRSAHEQEYRAHLETFCREVYLVPIRRSRASDVFHLGRSLLNGQPFLIARDHVAAMQATVRGLLAREHFDVVHADQLAMAQYADLARGPKKVLDNHNAMWSLVQRLWQQETFLPRKLVLDREWRATRRYEAEIVKRFDHTFCVTAEDSHLLRAVLNDETRPIITPIPICIDAPAFPAVETNPGTHNTICIGGMFYPPNVDGVLWYAREVLPLLRREVPDTRFHVVGARPDPAILAQAERDSSIDVTGYVQDTTPLLRDSAVFVVPLRSGGGMRVKILEAWARGMAVVSTRIGCEGIEVRNGENILLADTPEEFARAALRLVCDPALAREVGAAGRRWVESHYNWRVRYAEFSEVYAGLGA